jgi:hypothetical protein
MELASSSETQVTAYHTRRHIPEDPNFTSISGLPQSGNKAPSVNMTMIALFQFVTHVHGCLTIAQQPITK